MIPQIKKMLYATDLSKNSSYAFLYAIDMAKRHDATVVILHAVEPIPAYVNAYSGISVAFKEKQQGEIIGDIKKTYKNFAKKRRLRLDLPALPWYPKFLSRMAIPRRKS